MYIIYFVSDKISTLSCHYNRGLALAAAALLLLLVFSVRSGGGEALESSKKSSLDLEDGEATIY
jgi:hypothetical protein